MVNRSSPLRISIWRNFVPKRPILSQNSQDSHPYVLDQDLVDLQEEIYTWRTEEALFDGIADNDVRESLREKLFGSLDASRPPSERGIDVLKEFIATAEAAIEDEKVEWTISQSASDEVDDSANKVKGLLAITLHFKWLADCFSDRPGISVSVR